MIGARFALFAFSSVAIWGQTATNFPFQAGNTWVYRTTWHGTVSTKTVEIAARSQNPGYFVVTGFAGAGPLDMRQTREGDLVVYDPDAKTDRLWAPLGAAEGSAFTNMLDQCSTRGVVKSRAAKYAGPIGTFTNATEVDYSGSCADAGIMSELYLPWVGMVQRIEQTIAGPRTWDLIYASLGGVTFVKGPTAEFGLNLDRTSYKQTDTMTARMFLQNASDQPLVLEFPSGQDYDVVFFDQNDKEVYRWSKGKAFTMVYRTVKIAGQKNWVVTIPLGKGDEGAALAPGQYVAEAYLATAGTQRQFLGRVSFKIEE